jgi:hypothetical protein
MEPEDNPLFNKTIDEIRGMVGLVIEAPETVNSGNILTDTPAKFDARE